MKKLILATLAALALTACTQATSPESNIYEGAVTCEEALALYSHRSSQVTYYNQMLAEDSTSSYDAYTSGLYKAKTAEAKAMVEANCH